MLGGGEMTAENPSRSVGEWKCMMGWDATRLAFGPPREGACHTCAFAVAAQAPTFPRLTPTHFPPLCRTIFLGMLTVSVTHFFVSFALVACVVVG